MAGNGGLLSGFPAGYASLAARATPLVSKTAATVRGNKSSTMRACAAGA